MNSQILIKINHFVKKRLIEFSGIFFALISIFILLSIISYSPNDPNFIYTPENTEMKNIGGFYGSVVSDFLLQSIGLISILFAFNFFGWGIKLITKKKISNFIPKIFFTLIYIILGTTVLNIFYNDSFWLIDNGNGGFVGRLTKENINYFTPLIENQYVIYSLILLTIIFFILSIEIKINEIIKIFTFPFFILKKIIYLFKNKKEVDNKDIDILNTEIESKNFQKKTEAEKQPILPFSKKKENKISENNFIKVNSDTKNK